MTVAPAPVYPAAFIGPTSFAVWAAQRPDEAEKIRSVYAVFAAKDRESVSGLLHEITESGDGKETALVVFLEFWGEIMVPHIIPLHGLGVRTCLSRKEYKVPIYAWALDTSAKQKLLTVKVEPEWILPSKERIEVKKVDAVDTALQDAELPDARVMLDNSMATEKLRATVEVYTPCCLRPALLTRACLPWESWTILCDSAK